MMTLNKSPNRPSNSQILLGKRAIVFGAGGSIGAAGLAANRQRQA